MVGFSCLILNEMRTTILAVTIVLLALGGAKTTADTIAYVVPTGTVGNQTLPGSQPQSLGLDFNVNSDIYITSLGVFDSGSDGLRSALTARLYNRDTREQLAALTFTPTTAGTLVGGSRFLTLDSALLLPAGFHGVIAVDYLTFNNEANGNRRVSVGNWTTDSGGGLISFVGSGRIGYAVGGNPVFPGFIETSPSPDVYAAGTFTFVAVPEPSTYALLSLGIGGLMYVSRRRR